MELFAHDRCHLRRKQAQAIGALVYRRDRTGNSTGRRGGFTEFFAAILSGKAPPQKSAKQNQVEQENSEWQKKSRRLEASYRGQGAARERRWEPWEVWQKAQERRPDRRAVTLHQGRNKIQRNHGENKQAKKKFPSPPPGEQTLQPGTNQPLNRYIEHHERTNDQQHGREQPRLGGRGSGRHSQQPADRRQRREIGESVRQPNDVERAETQRKAQQG